MKTIISANVRREMPDKDRKVIRQIQRRSRQLVNYKNKTREGKGDTRRKRGWVGMEVERFRVCRLTANAAEQEKDCVQYKRGKEL